MKKNFKRLLSLVSAIVMLFTANIPVMAMDETSDGDLPVVEVKVTKISDDTDGSGGTRLDPQIAYWVPYGTTSTTEIKSKFVVGLFLPAYLYGEATVSAPCTLYSIIYDSTGTNALGVATMTFTSAGTYSFSVSPSYVSYGTYYYGHFFNTSGITYSLKLYGQQ